MLVQAAEIKVLVEQNWQGELHQVQLDKRYFSVW